jgi:transposase
MGALYSLDLRERVVGAVEHDGLSCNQATARFGVAISTAITWVKLFRQTGSLAPDQMGGHKPRKIAGEQILLRRTTLSFASIHRSPGAQRISFPGSHRCSSRPPHNLFLLTRTPR